MGVRENERWSPITEQKGGLLRQERAKNVSM
jgi:hypothetical protein